MSIETTRFDAADFLDTEEARIAFLNDALEGGDPGYIAHAVGIVARSRGMGSLATATGLQRQALYRALSNDGNPTIATFFKVLNELGLRLSVAG